MYVAQPIAWTDRGVVLLDQRRLPAEEILYTYTDYREVAIAIREMVIRGAPAIGVPFSDRSRIARSSSGSTSSTRAPMVPASGTRTSSRETGTIPPFDGRAAACSVVTARPLPSSTPDPDVAVPCSFSPRTWITVGRSRSMIAFHCALASLSPQL